MPFILIFVGVALFFAALNQSYTQLFSQVFYDFTGSEAMGTPPSLTGSNAAQTKSAPFLLWTAAIMAIGAVGYVKPLRKPSDAMLVLVFVAIILDNGGFWQNLMAALQKGPSVPATSPSASSGTSAAAGAALWAAAQQMATSPATTAPLGQGGIGSDSVAGSTAITPLGYGGIGSDQVAGGTAVTPLGMGGIGSDSVSGGALAGSNLLPFDVGTTPSMDEYGQWLFGQLGGLPGELPQL